VTVGRHTKGTKDRQNSFVPWGATKNKQQLFSEKVTNIGDVAASLAEIFKIAKIIGRGKGQIA
jgi:hypothetical protein